MSNLSKVGIEKADQMFHPKENMLPPPLQVVLDAAGEHKKLGEHKYEVICPCHSGASLNLKIKYDSKTEEVFVNCFVCKRGGMSQIDLWDGCLKAWGLTPADFVEFIPNKEFIYQDWDGTVGYRVTKVAATPNKKKSCFFSRPNDKGGWINNLDGIPRLLYHLPELYAAKPSDDIYITEGEEDVETVEKRLGYIATTGGGNTSAEVFDTATEWLRGHNIIILPDNDEPGRRYADDVARLLFGVAKSVKIINLPVGERGDITDYVKAGGSKEAFDLIVNETPILTEAPVVKPGKSKCIIIERIDNMEHKETHWLWPDRIPAGTYSLLVGNQDVGKSVLSLLMATVVSTGGSWPDTPDEKVERGSVIIMSSEDDAARTIKPRLLAAGADCSKIVYISSFTEQVNGKTETRNLFNLTKDLDMLVDAIDQIGDVRLVIIDPITAFAGGKKENSNAEVRDYLNPLIALAEKRNLTIVGLNHMNKDATKEAAHRTLGSVAWTSAARAVWLVAFDPQNEGRRLFLPIKNNLSKVRTGLAFTLVNTLVSINGTECGHPACEFEPGIVEMTADDALNIEGRKKSVKKIDEAVEWLEEFLSDGPKLTTDIFDTAKANSMSEATINRAKVKLSIKPTQIRENNKIVGWEWALLG